MVPVAGDHSELGKEPDSAASGVPQQLIARVGEIENRVQEKRQDIQRCQSLTQMHGAVAEVVFQVIAFGLERIDILVLDLPASPSRSYDVGHRIRIQRMIGDEAIPVGFSAVFAGDEYPYPSDAHRICAVAQGNISASRTNAKTVGRRTGRLP